MYKKKPEGWLKHADFIVLDILCLHVAFVLSYWLRHGIQNPYAPDLYRRTAIVMTLADVAVLFFLETLKNVLRRGIYREFAVTLRHAVLVTLISVLYLFSVQQAEEYSRATMYVLGVIYFFVTLGVRILWKYHMRKRGRSGNKNSTLLLMTVSDMAEQVVERAKANNFENYRILGLALMDRAEAERGKTVGGIDAVAGGATVSEFIRKNTVDEVLISLPNGKIIPPVLLSELLEMGITVHTDLTAYGTVPGYQQLVEKVCGYTTVTTSITYASGVQLFMKRVLDILGGLVGCLIMLVLFLFVAPMIYHKSPGPIFFSQVRVGRNGRRFKLYKFRSMQMNAEEKKRDLMKENGMTDDMMFKLEFDPRVIGNRLLPDGTKKTGIGQFIRDTSIDEFPQFWNVLKGDMSLVGTRPPTEDEYAKYALHHKARLACKPGITGMWQVSGRSNIKDFEEVVRLDTEYINNWNLGKDIKILLLTVKAVLKKEGSM